ncbi:hypothetical protein [Streptomyces sp. NPDC001530]|uniref:hypothetical protein n=1 Tax=Streptomyces sp. NPDC001530 TaxID=3364582 RepID=UPI00369E63D1
MTRGSAGSSGRMGRSRLVVSVGLSSGTAVRRGTPGRTDSASAEDAGGASGNRAEAAGGGGGTEPARRSGRRAGNRRASAPADDAEACGALVASGADTDVSDASAEKSKKSKDRAGDGIREARPAPDTASAPAPRGPSPSTLRSPRPTSVEPSPMEGGSTGRGGTDETSPDREATPRDEDG